MRDLNDDVVPSCSSPSFPALASEILYRASFRGERLFFSEKETCVNDKFVICHLCNKCYIVLYTIIVLNRL